MTVSDPTMVLALAILGAIVGSFAATLVVRWPAGRSVTVGRSRCDGCGRNLRAAELIPLASALFLRGRCARCGMRIDPRHWQIEAMCALVGAAAACVAPFPLALAGALFGWQLVTLAALDVGAIWLPDRLTGLLAATGLAAALIAPPPLADRLIGGAAGFASLWLIGRGYKAWRGIDGLGGGDPKLFGAIGLWLGWRPLPAVLLLAALVGLAAVALAMARGRQVAADTKLPFGALLAVAAYPAWLVMIGLGP